MRKSLGKLIFWCVLGILTLAWPAFAELSLETAPERSVGEKMSPAITAQLGIAAVKPEPATLMLLAGSGLMAMSARVMRKCRIRVR